MAAGLRVAVCKPAQTGVRDDGPGDLQEIRRLAGDRVRLVELARYPDPLAPDTAAQRSGRPLLTLEEIVDTVRMLDAEYDLTLVEGAGGLLVRLGAGGFTLADVAAALGAPAVIVAAAGLARSTTPRSPWPRSALQGRVSGVIIGSWPTAPDLAERCNLDDLPDVTGVPVVGRIPAGSGALDARVFATRASRWSDLPLPTKRRAGGASAVL